MEPAKKKGGWKTNLGGFFKALGGSALAWFSQSLPEIISGAAGSGTKAGVAIAIGVTILGDALQKIGIGHKQERTVEAVEENTQAVKDAS